MGILVILLAQANYYCEILYAKKFTFKIYSNIFIAILYAICLLLLVLSIIIPLIAKKDRGPVFRHFCEQINYLRKV